MIDISVRCTYTCISLLKKTSYVTLLIYLQKTSYEEKTSSVTYSTVSLYRTCVQNQQETNHARVKKPHQKCV